MKTKSKLLISMACLDPGPLADRCVHEFDFALYRATILKYDIVLCFFTCSRIFGCNDGYSKFSRPPCCHLSERVAQNSDKPLQPHSG